MCKVTNLESLISSYRKTTFQLCKQVERQTIKSMAKIDSNHIAMI